MPQPRRHHFIPKSFQEWWTVDGRLFLKDVTTGRVRRGSPHNTGVIRDYYRIVYGSGRPDLSVEGLFATLESSARNSIQALAKGQSLTAVQRSDLAQFVAFMHTRVPRFMDKHDRTAEQMLRQRIRERVPDEEAAVAWLATQSDLPGRLTRYSPAQVLKMLHGGAYRIRIPDCLSDRCSPAAGARACRGDRVTSLGCTCCTIQREAHHFRHPIVHWRPLASRAAHRRRQSRDRSRANSALTHWASWQLAATRKIVSQRGSALQSPHRVQFYHPLDCG